MRSDLCSEAIRLGSLLLRHRPLQLPAVHALLALMMLQAARLPARTQHDGTLAILERQDRSLWDQNLISAGLRHFGCSAAGNVLTAYHLQAEVAAIHATSGTDAETDWAGVAARYDQLYELEPTPIVALNGAIANASQQADRRQPGGPRRGGRDLCRSGMASGAGDGARCGRRRSDCSRFTASAPTCRSNASARAAISGSGCTPIASCPARRPAADSGTVVINGDDVTGTDPGEA